MAGLNLTVATLPADGPELVAVATHPDLHSGACWPYPSGRVRDSVRGEMNAYVMTTDGVHAINGACRLQVCEDEVVLVHGDDRDGHPMAVVKLADRLWIALGEGPPACLQQPGRPAEPESTDAVRTFGPLERTRWISAEASVGTGEGGWPPEPPPVVDSED